MLLVVGSSPTPRYPRPWSGRLRTNLCGIFDVTDKDLNFRVRLVNLFTAPGKSWSAPEWRQAARRVSRVGHPNIVLLGRKVAQAFGLPAGWPELIPYPRLEGSRERHYYVLPHPSGKNLWWNSEENTRAGTELCRRLLAAAEERPVILPETLRGALDAAQRRALCKRDV